MAKAPAEVSATEELEKYIDATENNFEIDLNYSPRQRVTELFNSNRESLYTAIPLPQNGLDNELNSAKKKKAHFQQLEKEYC